VSYQRDSKSWGNVFLQTQALVLSSTIVKQAEVGAIGPCFYPLAFDPAVR